MRRIKTAIAIDTVKKRSKTDDGRGTIIMAKIAITNITTLRSFCPSRKFKLVPTCCFSVNFFLANVTHLIIFNLLIYLQESDFLKNHLSLFAVYLKMAK